MLRFKATQDFFCKELNSHYVAGMSYTVRPGNDKLAALVKIWLGEGKVTLGGAVARIKGEG